MSRTHSVCVHAHAWGRLWLYFALSTTSVRQRHFRPNTNVLGLFSSQLEDGDDEGDFITELLLSVGDTRSLVISGKQCLSVRFDRKRAVYARYEGLCVCGGGKEMLFEHIHLNLHSLKRFAAKQCWFMMDAVGIFVPTQWHVWRVLVWKWGVVRRVVGAQLCWWSRKTNTNLLQSKCCSTTTAIWRAHSVSVKGVDRYTNIFEHIRTNGDGKDQLSVRSKVQKTMKTDDCLVISQRHCIACFPCCCGRHCFLITRISLQSVFGSVSHSNSFTL